ncbi:hypothetical protein SKAU_G00430700, partial [Synaphobranchus kaupii]
MGDSLGLVGKRLLFLFGDVKAAAETKALRNRDWLRGTVRAVSVIGLDSPGVEVFVEFEECPLQRRSWIQIYGEDVCVVLVESAIVWVARSDTTLSGEGATVWPALSYRPLVDRVGLGSLVPVESFVDRTLNFLPDGDSLQRFEVEKETGNCLLQDQPSLQAAVRSWHRDFELQEVLRRGSCTIQGQRVRVYQPEFDQPWALGLVSQHNSVSHIMEVTIDKGEEKQLVDPRVIHVMLAEDLSEEAGMGGWGRKESDGGKGEIGRRRRNASEGDGDVVPKRPKASGERDVGGNNNGGGASSNSTNEGVATWATAAVAGGGVNSSASATAPPPGGVSPNSFSITSLCQSHADGRALPTHTPTPPPPLKPAPVPPLPNTPFPATGHMPRLTRAASPKPTTTAPPEGDKGTAALVNSSPPLQDPKPSIMATAGFKIPATPVFGEGPTRTPMQPNRTAPVTDGRSFGFSFSSGGEPARDVLSSQNVFFQCLATGGQGSSGGCFPAATQDAAPGPAKVAGPSDVEKKTGGLFGSVPPVTLDIREQDKVLEPLTGAKPSSMHENLFLHAPKGNEPANPFLLFREKTIAHSPFGGQSAPQPTSTTAPDSVAMVTNGSCGPADGQQNLFTMSEPPKSLLTSLFSSCLPRAPQPTALPLEMPKSSRDGTESVGQVHSAGSGFFSVFSGAIVSGCGDVPLDFVASPKNFSLDNRGLSLKQESDSSTNNSDLSDLSEAEDGPGGAPRALGEGAGGALLLEKSKGVGRGRPRSKPCT